MKCIIFILIVLSKQLNCILFSTDIFTVNSWLEGSHGCGVILMIYLANASAGFSLVDPFSSLQDSFVERHCTSDAFKWSKLLVT